MIYTSYRWSIALAITERPQVILSETLFPGATPHYDVRAHLLVGCERDSALLFRARESGTHE